MNAEELARKIADHFYDENTFCLQQQKFASLEEGQGWVYGSFISEVSNVLRSHTDEPQTQTKEPPQ